jgi:hypothetical protein
MLSPKAKHAINALLALAKAGKGGPVRATFRSAGTFPRIFWI